MTTLLVIIGALLLITCIVNWRLGVTICLVVGFLQDPIRKLIPGEPLVLVVAVGIFAVAALAGMWREHGVTLFVPVYAWYPPVKAPLIAFLALLTVQFMVTLIVHGNAVVAGIGMMSYLGPFVAVVLSYYYVRNLKDIDQLLSLYAGLAIVVAIGVLLSFFGVDWAVLQQVGAGLTIYDLGTILEAHTGFMRASEVAAWHMGAGICFIVVLVNVRRSWPIGLLGGILVALLFTAVLMTGRRKMIIQTLQFVMFYGFLLLYFHRVISGKLLLSAGLAAVGVWLAVETLFPGGYGSQFDLYARRGASVFASAWDRFVGLGIKPVSWAINWVGPLGGGLGIGSQGAGRFAELHGGIRGAAEGGLGKITVELGVPGLVLIAWLLAALASYVSKILSYVSTQGDQAIRLFAGLAAFLLANMPTFMVASQVYGDLFVLLVLGWVLGTILAVPLMAAQAVAPARPPELHPVYSS